MVAALDTHKRVLLVTRQDGPRGGSPVRGVEWGNRPSHVVMQVLMRQTRETTWNDIKLKWRDNPCYVASPLR